MTCFDRDELADLVAGLAVVGPWVAAALIALGWALAILANTLMHRPRPPARRARRRRRPPLAVLSKRAHNPDIDGVFAPPPTTEEDS